MHIDVAIQLDFFYCLLAKI